MVSVRRTPGISGCPGKWPSKIGLSSGTTERASMRCFSWSRPTTRSIMSKYSRRIGAGDWRAAKGGDLLAIRHSPSRVLRRDERIDARHQVLEDEILLGGHFPLVDLLGPLLER